MFRKSVAKVEIPEILRRWDRSSQSSRQQILDGFVKECRGFTAAQLEARLNNSASLFLARIVSMLRLTYSLGPPVSIQLQAIYIFLSAASGRRWVLEFLEVGGGQTILDIISLPSAPEVDRQEALRLLMLVGGLGRRYKEMLCANDCVYVLTSALETVKADVTRDTARTVLQSLATGNPMHLADVQSALLGTLSSHVPAAQCAAAMMLRSLEHEMPPTDEYASLSKSLLRSSDIRVQYEGGEVLKMLLKYDDLRRNVLDLVLEALAPSINAIAEVTRTEVTIQQRQTSLPSLYASSARTAPPAFLLQAAAARLVGEVAASSQDMAAELLERDALLALLAAASNVDFHDSQLNACGALRIMVHQLQEARARLRQHLGKTLFNRLMSTPDGLIKGLNRNEIDILKQGFQGFDEPEDEAEQRQTDALIAAATPQPSAAIVTPTALIPQVTLSTDTPTSQTRTSIDASAFLPPISEPLSELPGMSYLSDGIFDKGVSFARSVQPVKSSRREMTTEDQRFTDMIHTAIQSPRIYDDEPNVAALSSLQLSPHVSRNTTSQTSASKPSPRLSTASSTGSSGATSAKAQPVRKGSSAATKAAAETGANVQALAGQRKAALIKAMLY